MRLVDAIYFIHTMELEAVKLWATMGAIAVGAIAPAIAIYALVVALIIKFV